MFFQQLQPNIIGLDKFIELAVSITIFFLGALLTLVFKWSDEKNQIKNIRTIIAFELYMSLNLYNIAIKMEDNSEIQLIIEKCRQIERVSTLIFDKYLDRIYLLKQNEVENTLLAYKVISMHKVKCQEILVDANTILEEGWSDIEEINEKNEEKIRNYNKYFDNRAHLAIDNIKEALALLSKGNKQAEYRFKKILYE